jgi:hypothetical protein
LKYNQAEVVLEVLYATPRASLTIDRQCVGEYNGTEGGKGLETQEYDIIDIEISG